MKKLAPEQERELKKQYATQLAMIADELPNLNPFSFMTLRDFMETNDKSDYSKHTFLGAQKLGCGFVAGVISSLILTQINPFNFLKKSWLVKVPVRMGVIAIPIVIASSFLVEHVDTLQKIQVKYDTRLDRFRRTKDFNYMDPTGDLFREFVARTHN